MSRRKNLAQREPNGRAQRDPPLPPPSEVRRLRDAALAGMRDPMWGTELGRLHLAGKITATMFAAGRRWAELASQYSQALCSPSPDPKAISLERSSGGTSHDPDSAEGRKEARRHARAVQSFIDANVALKDHSRASERIVRSTCERGEMVHGHQDMMALTGGLERLASFWGLTGGTNRLSDRHIRTYRPARATAAGFPLGQAGAKT
jgi:hypothetical protein